MKIRSLVLFNLIVLAIGVTFAFLSRSHDIMRWVITITGGGFILLAAINAIMLSRTKSSEIREIQESMKTTSAKKSKSKSTDSAGKSRRGGVSLAIGWVCSIGAAVLGIVMLAVPDLFRPLLFYIFALTTFLGGCYQIWFMSKAIKPVSVPMWFFSLPVIMIVLSVVMVMMPSLQLPENQSTVVLIYGIGFILFAASSFLNMIYYKANLKKALAPVAEINDNGQTEEHKIEDVEAKDVTPSHK